MRKTKVIIISVIAIVFVLAVIFSVAGSFLRSHKGRSIVSNNGFNTSAGTKLSDSSIKNFSNPMAVDSKEKTTASENYSSQSSELSNTLEDIDKKIIKNGNLNFKVDNVDKAVEDISSIAKTNGGDIFSSNFYKNSQDIKSGRLTVKVPVANFETTYTEIKKVAAAVLRESTSGRDVTEQYQDLEGQIKNKQAEEAAYQKILDQAQKIDDILSITRSLSTVRGQIERLQGRLRYLASQTDMSTITVNMSEDANITISDSWRPLQVAKEAIHSLVVKVQKFVDFLIIFVIIFIPTAILYLILLWIIYKIGRIVYVKIFKKKEKVL